MFFSFRKLFIATLLISFVPIGRLWACACGCGVFDVGTNGMLMTNEGGMTFVEYDFMDQDKNWNGTSSSPAENNEDKRIKSDFITAGLQYMFNRRWGARAEVPFWHRTFDTTDEDENMVSFTHSSVGDIRLKGVFSGFSPDMSSGVTFGVKLPTGDYKFHGFDRDTAIGTGSTDLLLGAYKVGGLPASPRWNWFANSELDLPVLITPAYRPGSEIDVALGGYYDGWRTGAVKIAPLAQLIGSHRWSDTGQDSSHPDSGYQRLVLSPGVELSLGRWRIYGDVGFPIYQDVNGQQLVATKLYKINVSRFF